MKRTENLKEISKNFLELAGATISMGNMPFDALLSAKKRKCNRITVSAWVFGRKQ